MLPGAELEMAKLERLVGVTNPAGDAEAIKHLKEAIAGGKHWYVALLEAMGLWASAEEIHNGRTYRYLIGGEAFDWLLLAERLCEEADGLVPEKERDELLFQGKPPLNLSPAEVRGLIGSSKYRQYLNYFYGITVETALLTAMLAEVYKERWMLGYTRSYEAVNEAYRRVYGATRAVLLKRFRQEKGCAQTRSVSLTDLKEFTYWLFKYRLAHSEKARVASDTRKALDYLRRQSASGGFREALVAAHEPVGV